MKTKSQSHTYIVWKGLKSRCLNPNAANYPQYGGRGVTIPESWRTFAGFVEDMGMAPSDAHTLDRIDGAKSYTKDNARWTDQFTQARNKRNAILLTFRGRTRHVCEWAEDLGISVSTIRARLRWGWTDAEALTPPMPRKASTGRHGPKAKSFEDNLVWEQGCLVWKGTVINGFGIYKGRSVHRIAMEKKLDHPIDLTVDVFQTCGNKLCCRRDHLRQRLRTNNPNRKAA